MLPTKKCKITKFRLAALGIRRYPTALSAAFGAATDAFYSH